MADDRDATVRTDVRQSKRAALMLRRAKLVCQSGEYLCLIRDVSELGVGLGFLHAVPPEPRTLLQLANDLTYPIERVWLGKRQAGYRFGCEVALDDFLREQGPHQNRPLRINIAATAVVREGRDTYTAKLLDLSSEGAKIESELAHEPGRLVSLEVDGMAPQLGQVRWSEDDRLGLRFQHPLSSEELAACALHHQPFGQTRPAGFNSLLAKARAA